VRDFYRLLAAEMRKAGLGQWIDKRFTPHMTLSYGRCSLDAQATEPVAWTVRELVLVHSFIGQTRHEVLGRWPLGDEA
jgi:2'-5' RNA ligase